jgi:hypothetical protein
LYKGDLPRPPSLTKSPARERRREGAGDGTAGAIASRREEEVGMKRLTMEMAEERLPGLFEPHTILPVQFFTRFQRGASWTGEQRLMAAVLEDAIAVCCKPNPPRTSKARTVLRESLRWIRSNDRTWTFSFLRICETLDMDPSAIRRGVRIRRGEEPQPEPVRIVEFTIVEFTEEEAPKRTGTA